MAYTFRFFSLQNAVCFIILTYLVPVLFTFYIQGVLKFKKKNPAPKGEEVYDCHSLYLGEGWDVQMSDATNLSTATFIKKDRTTEQFSRSGP